jgi:hypothetical protein
MILRLKDSSLHTRVSFVLFKLFYKKRKFDERGLRYKHKILNAIKPQLYILPLEWLADFVDVITYGMVQTIIEKPYSHEANVAKERIASELDKGKIYFNHINTTGFGNLAYVALNHPHEYVRKEALSLLETCFDEHRDRQAALQNLQPTP